MNSAKIITHFSSPNWPVVNKLSGICKCLDVEMLHCSSLEKLRATIEAPSGDRRLLFTDEGLIEIVQEIAAQKRKPSIEVAMFIISPISEAAKKIGDLHIVKYLMGMQLDESCGRDLSILIKKFSDGDILDLGKYLAFGSRINERKVNSAKTKREAIDSVSNYVNRLGDPGYNHPFGEYARRMSELTDELLLNAIFDANPRMQNADRSQPFQLLPNEEIQMAWGYDGEYFGISVRDPFGRFRSEIIMNYLSTGKDVGSIISGQSGGLGLKLIFERSHQIVTNVRREQVTEVIALVKFVNRVVAFETQKKSFYFFDDMEPQKRKLN